MQTNSKPESIHFAYCFFDTEKNMNQIHQTFTNGRDAEHFKVAIVGGGLVRIYSEFNFVFFNVNVWRNGFKKL